MQNKKEIKTNIVKDILDICNQTNNNVLKAVNTALVIRNWLIGKRIAQEILTTRKQDYGKKLIVNLSKDLSKYGKGFSKENLYKYLKFYKIYNFLNLNIVSTVSTKSLLPWTYYEILIRVDNSKERLWYEQQTKKFMWSYRQLYRSLRTREYSRTISWLKLKTSHKNKLMITNNNELKWLYLFDFLNLKKNNEFKESELEQELINNLSKFLFELGNGYSFVGRQIRLKTDDNEYYIDLVFYNINLKRYLIIDLKVNEIKHSDIGQMTLYLELFDQQYKKDTDNDSIGMVLSSDLNSDIVRYLMAKTPNHIVASKYLTYLPTKDQLKKEIEKVKLALSKK